MLFDRYMNERQLQPWEGEMVMAIDVATLTGQFTHRPVWAEINLDAAAENMQALRRLVGTDVQITSIVKANGYGHGAVDIAKTYLANGANQLGVACLDEGVELRKAGITAPIIVLGHTDGRRAEELLTYDIDTAVFHIDDARLFSQAALRMQRVAKLHIAVDTGMGRIGYHANEEGIAQIKAIADLPNISIEGVFSHFSVSDMADEESIAYTKKQFSLFHWCYTRLQDEGISVPWYHCCSSAGIVEYGDFHLHMVRPGIVQYGYHPSDEVPSTAFTPKPVMSLKCCVSHIKVIEPGDTVSYGRRFTAKRRTTIATLPMGYADGYPRILSNKARVLIHGRYAPQIGTICMDQCMIDVTDIPDVRIGDEVVLFGEQGGKTISLEEVAHLAGTINHEILCNINRRVPRIYTRHDTIVRRLEYLSAKEYD